MRWYRPPEYFAASRWRATWALDGGGALLSTAANAEHLPAVASDGTGFLVAWVDDRGEAEGSDIYATHLSSAGVVLDPAGLAVSTAPGVQTSPSVASRPAATDPSYGSGRTR